MKARPIWVVTAAVLLPILVFGAVLAAFDAAQRREEAVAATFARARSLMNRTDAELRETVAAFDVLSTTASLRRGDEQSAAVRAREVRQSRPAWRSLHLIDPRDGRTVFTVGDAGPPLSLAETAFASGTDIAVDGIHRRPGRCTCILVGRTVETAAGAFRLVLELDPAPFQRILLDVTPAAAVSALVDRDGRFIARSVDYERRVGTFATKYVRNSLRGGAEGLYEGRTYEGLVNYTAYVRAPRSGWSSHMAVSSAVLEGPQRQWWAAISLAAAASLAFAAGLLWLSLRTYRAQRVAEERLRASERMETLGKLTGGVAHDFNNMLAIIVGSLDLAQRRLADREPRVSRHIGIALEGAQRAADLVQRMLAFARRQALDPEMLDPAVVLEEIRDLLSSTIGEDIHLTCRVEPGTRAIRADRVQLENALVNLAANARDAMPEGGRLTILASNAVGPSESRSGDTGRFVAIEVTDDGEGMPDEVRARALEPFFTTKEAGRGTGLGLSQVYGFVTQSGGDLRIESTPGAGTRVAMLFPAAETTTASAAASAAPVRATAAVHGRIVLVEDDARVRETVREALTELGHDVRLATDPRRVSALLDEAPADLVLSDVVMPDMSGPALARELAERHPGVAVMLMSAYARDADASRPVDLRKPFTIAELDAAVTRALQQRADRPDRPAQPPQNT